MKSELAVVGEVPYLEELANILNCSISFQPMKYMELPLSATFFSFFFFGYNQNSIRAKKRYTRTQEVYKRNVYPEEDEIKKMGKIRNK